MTGPVDDAEGQRLQKRYERQSTWVNVLRIIGRVLDLVSSSGTLTMMGLNLAKYNQTLHDNNGNQVLWSDSTYSWPNILAAAAAAITFVSSAAVLIAYCWGKDVAARLDKKRAFLAIFLLLVNVIIAGAAAIAMYRTREDPNSLSGQTCGAPPQKGPSFPQMDFERFCLMQDIGNGLLLVKVFTGLVGLLGFVCGCLDKRTKKKLDKRRNNSDNSGLVLAPIRDAKSHEEARFEDTRYTNLEPAKGRYQ